MARPVQDEVHQPEVTAHHGSAFLSTKKAIEEAEDRGFDAGREIGRSEGIEMVAAMYEAQGRAELAAEIRGAKLVERPGNVGFRD